MCMGIHLIPLNLNVYFNMIITYEFVAILKLANYESNGHCNNKLYCSATFSDANALLFIILLDFSL